MIHVIMPVYKVEPYLRDAVDSVLAQTYKDFELILVDDGSPDGCGRICDEYAEKYPNVRVIHKENGGVSSARNAALATIDDGYVAFVDSDDTIYEDMLENAAWAIMQNDADVALVGMETIVYNDGTPVHATNSEYLEHQYNSKSEIEEGLHILLKKLMWNFSVDKIYKTEIIKNNGILFNSYYNISGEDAVFLIDLLPYLNKISTTNRRGYRYAIRTGQSMVKSFRPDLFEKNISKINRLVSFIRSINQESSCADIIAQMTANATVWSYEQILFNNCPYGISEKLKYIKKTYKNAQIPQGYREKALEQIEQLDKNQISRLTKYAVKQILLGHLFLAKSAVLAQSFYLKVRKLNA